MKSNGFLYLKELPSTNRLHLDSGALESGAQLSGELRGVRAVAVDANRVDSNRDRRTVNRRDRTFSDHTDRASYRRARVVDVGVGSTSGDKRSVAHVVAISECLGRGTQSGGFTLADEMTAG